jgi:hypothetical protein
VKGKQLFAKRSGLEFSWREGHRTEVTEVTEDGKGRKAKHQPFVSRGTSTDSHTLRVLRVLRAMSPLFY